MPTTAGRARNNRATNKVTGRVLFLVPSIALLSQTMREWCSQASVPIRSFAVCSDSKVGRGRGKQDEDISVVDLAQPPTTDPAALARGLAAASDTEGELTVVFATYQSIDVVSQAQKIDLGGAGNGQRFDLIVCDEAHRTTGATLVGAQESAFVRVHDDSFLRARKRLYMTATPRIYDEASKARAGQSQAVLASMDDVAVYGEEFHRLGFGKAVEADLLSDYRVIVLTVDEGQVSRTMQDSLSRHGELDLPDLGRIIGCWNGLAKRDPSGGFGADIVPMRRAVAFARDIKTSQYFSHVFEDVVSDYVDAARHGGAPIENALPVEVRHVDGSMNILARNHELEWLKGGDEEASCRVLSNARCLSEGVDVPALDAVIFLNPRKSQVDIVQSVGRVMRKAAGKKYGYIILPVAVPSGMKPEEVLKDNERFRVVWEVLQALRAHDERFDALVNKIDLNKQRPAQVKVIAVGPLGGGGEPGVDAPGSEQVVELPLDQLEDWRSSIYARLVEKVGSRRYWENWAKDIADIAQRHRTRLEALVENPEVAGEFETFVEGLRANLNDSITPQAALEMLSQHMISKPVFDALFEGHDFAATNPVAAVMQRMLDLLEGSNLEAETQDLDEFYASVRLRCAGIDNAEGKQRVIAELYEKFFKLAFKKTADALGIVYTPIEVVDFINRSVDALLKRHFGRGISEESVHVLDPFTGTGTFISRLLQSGLIRPEDLLRKYARELHANEIMLLAYYIAAANIEVTMADVAADACLETPGAFPGILLTDTFQMHEAGDTLDQGIFESNHERAEAQKALDIRCIIGNPPYSVGQGSANDNNANLKYPTLDGRIEATYAARSAATNKNSLYDSYIRAIRWASDRIGDAGVIGFVTNGGFIEGNSSAGVRLCLGEEFSDVYIYNLRGNQRTAGELSKREGGKIFGAGSRNTVVVSLLVKNPAHTGPATIHYLDIGDYLSREEKLAKVARANLEELEWTQIRTSAEGDWLGQRDPLFSTWQGMGGKDDPEGIFRSRSNGLKTNRDAWVYGFSRAGLEERGKAMVTYYNECAAAGQLPQVLDPTMFSWNRADKANVRRKNLYTFDAGRVFQAAYRPFTRSHVVFDRSLNDMVYGLPGIFPTPRHGNLGFYQVGNGSAVPFSTLATADIPDLHVTGAGSGGQFFPRWTWVPAEKVDTYGQGAFELGDKESVVLERYRRVDNITDATLAAYRNQYGSEVTKDQIFAYVYGILHSPEYRSRFAVDLKRSLPRIPRVPGLERFLTFAQAGQRLLDIHAGYENVVPHPLQIEGDAAQGDPYQWFAVTKMRYGAKGKDKSVIEYSPSITVAGIPLEAHDYMLGARSALDWIVDRYQIKTDKASGIVSDPNDWAREVGNPRYILDLIGKVTAVSLETNRLTAALPPLGV
ncbi:type ISP restriction/modification enzyme [Buchananella felis]|uniref:type ISP restriction/modification enzyme n=1 Tax=Buchananella felis TaxID=3231492 RepID=UPI00352869F3